MGVDRIGTRHLGIGDVVAVRDEAPAHHHRTPWFVKGKIGRIAAINGRFFNPESRAYGRDGLPKRRLCSVEFRQVDLWGVRYRENAGDRLVIDIYEHWLDPVV